MSGYKNNNFSERLTTAARARKALLDSFQARPASDDQRHSYGPDPPGGAKVIPSIPAQRLSDE
jgi:hypothetical protein